MEVLRLGSTGPNVKLIQSLLRRIGYAPGLVDGTYGYQTRRAVINFQRNNVLSPDGIVGEKTWEKFNRLLEGYDIYTIRPGDTLYDISIKYYTTVNAIMTANPTVDPMNLMVGQEIVVPYGIDVVYTDVDYTYEILERNIRGLKARYPFLEIGTIGQSVLGKNLYYIRIGSGQTEVSYNGAHHAIEWITAPLLMKYIENFSKAYSSGRSIRGYDTRDIWNSSSVYIVPMVNPDGVDLVLEGLQTDNPYYDQLLEWNNTGLPFSQVWKANIRGVDLNRNYPASWEEGKAQEESFGVYGPAPTRYGGPYPLSEPESLAMVEFTRDHDFKLVIAYHTQGEVIYWKYQDIVPSMAYEYGQIFSRSTGYTLSDVPYEAAFAGYKDWFIEEFNRPGYTFEVGTGVNPISITQFNTIYDENEEVMLLSPII